MLRTKIVILLFYTSFLSLPLRLLKNSYHLKLSFYKVFFNVCRKSLVYFLMVSCKKKKKKVAERKSEKLKKKNKGKQ